MTCCGGEQAPTENAICFKELFSVWEQQYACKVITAMRDSFQDMFDDDATLEYEPATTAAIILTGGDAEAEKAALKVSSASWMMVLADTYHQTHILGYPHTDKAQQGRFVRTPLGVQ